MDGILENLRTRDAAAYIPHQGRMRLVDSITALDREQKAGEVLSRLREEAPYFQGEQFQQHWLIEIMAQAAAAISQVLRDQELSKAAPRGYLIAIKDFSIDELVCLCLCLRAGDELRSSVRFDVDLDPIGHCESSIFASDGRRLATSDMTFLSDEMGPL